MALILNIDTSSKSTSVALAENGSLVALKEEHKVVSHASKLTPFIEELLESANKSYKDISAIAISIGPGSYTGLRIGLSTAKGLSYALKIPIIAICPLKAMANMIMLTYGKNNKLFVSTMNSRKNEIYCTILALDNAVLKGPSAVVLDETFLQEYENESIVIAGTGVEKVKEVLKSKNIKYKENYFFSAENMISLSNEKYNKKEFEDLAYLEPNYLKPFITT